MTEIYCVMVTGLSHEWLTSPVDHGWHVGLYLRWRPAIIEGNHGPGGFARWEAVAGVKNADFMERTAALKVSSDMTRQYEGIEFGVVRFRYAGRVD